MNLSTKRLFKASSFIFMLSCIVMIGVVGYNEKHSENKTDPNDKSYKIELTSEYYADTDKYVAKIPDDSLPITLYIGELKPTKDGKVEFIEDGVKLINLPQRAFNIAFKVTDIPNDQRNLLLEADKIVEKWENYGNQVTSIFIDYRPATPDFKKYSQLLHGMKRLSDNLKYKAVSYHTAALIDAKWLSDKKYADYIKLKDEADFFYVTPDDNQLKSEEFLKSLNNIGYAFKIIIPSGIKKDIAKPELIMQNNFLGNAMLKIDDAFVPIDKKPRVYALPKFLVSEQKPAK